MRVTSDLLAARSTTLRTCMSAIDRNSRGIVLIVDEERHLLGTLTDGDLRRAVLAGLDLDLPASELLARKVSSPHPLPTTAPVGTEPGKLLALMRELRLRHIPLLDPADRVEELVTLEELVPADAAAPQAVVMAGGFGTRLLPLTSNTPKPMLPVGDRPLLQRVIEQLREAGIRQVTVTAHYLAERISEHFGDGRAFDVDLQYVTEESPLGTAGALALIEPRPGPILVVNGDILTSLDFRSLLAFHQEHRAELTVAVRKYQQQVPYGVVECDGARVRRLVEKPVLEYFINAGIYVIEGSVLSVVPSGRRFDMTDLIEALLERGQRVVSFPLWEYWVDAGQHADYERANADAARGVLES